MIRASCPHCKTLLQMDDQYANQVVTCGSCGKSLRLPAAPAPAPIASEPIPVPPQPQVEHIPVEVVEEEPPSTREDPLSGEGQLSADVKRMSDKVRMDLGFEGKKGGPGYAKELPCAELPDKCVEAANIVGRPISSFELGAFKDGMILAAVCAVIMFIPLLVWLVLYFIGVTHPAVGPICGCIAVLFLIFALIAFCTAAFSYDQIIWLCPNGLIWQRIQHESIEAIRWENVTNLQVSIIQNIVNGVRGVIDYVYRIETTQEITIVLNSDHLFGARAIGEHIQSEVTRVQLPLYKQRFQQGETLDFGVFQLHKSGVVFRDKKECAWREISEIAIEKGNLYVDTFARDNWAVTALPTVSHSLIFLNITREILLTVDSDRQRKRERR